MMNVRVFSYIHCSLLRTPEEETSTVRIALDSDQWMSTHKMKEKGIMLPGDKSNLKTEVKKYRKR